MSSWHERWTWHSETTANNGTLEGVSIHQGQRRSSMHLWWGRIKSRNPNVSHKALGPECRRACKTRHCDAWIVHSWIATSHLQLLQATCKVFEDWYDKESRVFLFFSTNLVSPWILNCAQTAGLGSWQCSSLDQLWSRIRGNNHRPADSGNLPMQLNNWEKALKAVCRNTGSLLAEWLW